MIIPPLFDGLPVKAFFTTKALGCTPGDISLKCSVPVSHIYLPLQKHTDSVLVIDHDLQPAIADAVVTNRPGILIGVRVADCVPILLYDPVRKVAGAVHAGWRGTAAGILKKTVQVMTDRFKSEPSSVLMAVGPSIRGCCYEVDGEVAESVLAATGEGAYSVRNGEKYYLDLASANRCQALSAGLSAAHLWIADACTRCLPEEFYSYRFAPGMLGRQAGFIGIV
jgi:hypothetical protein